MKFYAAYNHYGRISLDSFGGHSGTVYFAFASKAERDSWVDANCYDNAGNVVAFPVLREEVADRRACGHDFVIVNGVCRPKHWETNPDWGDWELAEELRARK